MTLHTPLWMQDGSYPGSLDRQLIDVLVGEYGGIVASGDFVVSQRAAGINLSVDVAGGRIFVPGTDTSNQGKYLCWSDGVTNVPLEAAPGAGESRWDLIVVKVRDEDAIGGSNSDFVVTYVKGTAASSPVGPTVPASCYVLAWVSVGSEVTTITDGDITDVRALATPGISPADTGWQPISQADAGWTNTGQWRRIGNRVEIYGSVNTSSGFNDTNPFAAPEDGGPPVPAAEGASPFYFFDTNIFPVELYITDGHWQCNFLNGGTSFLGYFSGVTYLVD